MSDFTWSWWLALCVVSALNMTAWVASALLLERRRPVMPTREFGLRRWLLLLAGVYVLGCAYRSVCPVFDIPRQVLFDSWWASVVVGRSVATVAELCFVTQWALLLRESARHIGSRIGGAAALAIVPLIALAEVCSWYSVLTTSNLGHVIEESLWGLCAAALVTSLALIWPRVASTQRPVLALWCGSGVAYVVFMFGVDVPMYWSRWIVDEASGRHYLSVAQGLLDVSGRWVVSHRWDDWKGEVTWMSLYFSVAVWLSIALVHAPVHRPRSATV